MSTLRVIALVVALTVGCDRNLSVAPVSGVIIWEGKPLAGASITTQPIAQAGSQNPGPGSFGHTDEQGRFELELVKPTVKGAIIGEHRVMISRAADADAANQPRRSADGVEYWTDDPNSNRQPAGINWPARYTDGSLRLHVPPEGTDVANFNLTAKP
jgi:hypothetical protein